MISTARMNESDDDEFQSIDEKAGQECVDLGGFQLVEPSNSVLLPSKKGLMQAFTDGVKVKVTNLYYNMQDAPKCVSQIKFQPGDCYILGKRILSSKELKDTHKSLLYFSYREFKDPIKYKGQQFFNDTCKVELLKAGDAQSGVLR